MKKSILLTLCLIYSIACMANKPPIPKNEGMDFVVIQNLFVFNRASIKSATLDLDNKGVYRGLHIQLKQSAIKAFEQVVKTGNGKLAAFVYKQKVLSSSVIKAPLGDNLLLQVPRIEAEAFIASLKST